MTDRRLNWLVAMSFLTATALILAAFLLVPRLLQGASTTEALDRQNRISTCRAIARTELVDDPQARLQVARARLDERTNEGLEAVARGDDDTLTALLDTFADLRGQVEAAAADVESGSEEYRNRVALSQSNPTLFLTTYC